MIGKLNILYNTLKISLNKKTTRFLEYFF